ncbi:MAG TPA: RluA family pseudouridine synthase, partial [Candidatus Acidoferrales bacterium]|nr:RluA family pseudouridine synthase [Candidatus Acidoferrales bacterium]
KTYLALVRGRWRGGARDLRESLHKYVTSSGERRVAVREDGMRAHTRVVPLASSEAMSVLELRLLTGRTHQIRVHLAHAGHPVVGDDKYGDSAADRATYGAGARRLMLHARRLAFPHPVTGEALRLESPPPRELRELAEAQVALPADRL